MFVKKTNLTAFSELMRVGKEKFIKDTNQKKEDFNKRMDNFEWNSH